MSAEYEKIGEFHDLFMDTPWKKLQPLLAETFGHLGPADQVIDLGAGSGMGTCSLAKVSRSAITAIEPSLVMRAMLLARVTSDADLTRRVTVLADKAPGTLKTIEGPIAGFVCAHMLGHVTKPERQETFSRLATLLAPGGVGLITLPGPSTIEQPDEVIEESRRIGRHTYIVRHVPTSDAEVHVSEYEVRDGQTTIRRERFPSGWRPPSLEELRSELSGAGFSLDSKRAPVGLVRIEPEVTIGHQP